MTGPVPLRAGSIALIVIASLGGMMMFGWPLLIPATGVASGAGAPLAFVLLLPILLLLVLAGIAERGMDAKALAMLGVLSAINAALRPLGAGTGGIEVVFFLLILAGRVFGAGFGFVLGALSLFASALLTAGVGPWLPFQMLAAAWIGLGAGLLPRRAFGHPIRGIGEVVMLIVYAVVVSYVFGALMNLWFWPYITGAGVSGTTDLSYIPGGGLGANLTRFFWYTLLTSTAVWDTGRAITNAVLIAVVGVPLLAALRRTQRRARFDAE